ncbi:DUF488 domain-containing protein [Nostoc sp.]|uniref:DUF488 domain-containing protein n=1 Tax=Nostoc sp. TaxID=1180 RepID=UPI002FFB7A86
MTVKDIAKTRCILTFGYGNRKDYDAFLEYLQKFDVECVIDVRMVPRAWSRKWYGDKIKLFCELNNIEYISKTALGNTSGKENWIPGNQEEADIALHEIAKIAQTVNVLLLCAEMNPNRCHRKEVAHCLGNLVSMPVKHLE